MYGTAFGDKKLDSLTAADVLAWRNRLAKSSTPAHTNRNLKSLKAALNFAFRSRLTHSDAAWKHVAQISGARESRDIYLTVDQRREFISACPDDLANYLRGLLYTGARPQELAICKVSDLDARTATLKLTYFKGKSADPKERHFPLHDDALTFFKRRAGDRIGNQPLMTCRGEGWYSSGGQAGSLLCWKTG